MRANSVSPDVQQPIATKREGGKRQNKRRKTMRTDSKFELKLLEFLSEEENTANGTPATSPEKHGADIPKRGSARRQTWAPDKRFALKKGSKAAVDESEDGKEKEKKKEKEKVSKIHSKEREKEKDSEREKEREKTDEEERKGGGKKKKKPSSKKKEGGKPSKVVAGKTASKKEGASETTGEKGLVSPRPKNSSKGGSQKEDGGTPKASASRKGGSAKTSKRKEQEQEQEKEYDEEQEQEVEKEEKEKERKKKEKTKEGTKKEKDESLRIEEEGHSQTEEAGEGEEDQEKAIDELDLRPSALFNVALLEALPRVKSLSGSTIQDNSDNKGTKRTPNHNTNKDMETLRVKYKQRKKANKALRAEKLALQEDYLHLQDQSKAMKEENEFLKEENKTIRNENRILKDIAASPSFPPLDRVNHDSLPQSQQQQPQQRPYRSPPFPRPTNGRHAEETAASSSITRRTTAPLSRRAALQSGRLSRTLERVILFFPPKVDSFSLSYPP